MDAQEPYKRTDKERLLTVAGSITECKSSMAKVRQLVTSLQSPETPEKQMAILKELEGALGTLTNQLDTIELAASPPATLLREKALKGIRVLLAEDDDIAGAMATRMLERNGAIIARVYDGAAATKMSSTYDFDIILMDVQMPEMNGLMAAKIIREDQKKKTPIIALTAGKIAANASYADAGMNDAIAKPYKEQTLVEIILRYLGAGVAPTSVNETGPEEKQLYSIDKLIAMGDQAFVNRMLNLFIEQVPASVSKLKEAYGSSDFETVKYLAHRLRPSIRNMGISQAEQEVDQIEELAEEGTQSAVLEQLIKHVEKVTAEVVLELRKYLEGR